MRLPIPPYPLSTKFMKEKDSDQSQIRESNSFPTNYKSVT